MIFRSLKFVLSMLLAVSLLCCVICLSGCGGKDGFAGTGNEPSDRVSETTDAATETTDTATETTDTATDTTVTVTDTTDKTTESAAQTTGTIAETNPPVTTDSGSGKGSLNKEELLESLRGFWNSDDSATLISFTQREDGVFIFGLGEWYSEYSLYGELNDPFDGDPKGILKMVLANYGDEELGAVPTENVSLTFDLSSLEEGWFLFHNDYINSWVRYNYAGATLEEAMPAQP